MCVVGWTVYFTSLLCSALSPSKDVLCYMDKEGITKCERLCGLAHVWITQATICVVCGLTHVAFGCMLFHPHGCRQRSQALDVDPRREREWGLLLSLCSLSTSTGHVYLSVPNMVFFCCCLVTLVETICLQVSFRDKPFPRAGHTYIRITPVAKQLPQKGCVCADALC
jgi:hypothetical protein